MRFWTTLTYPVSEKIDYKAFMIAKNKLPIRATNLGKVLFAESVMLLMRLNILKNNKYGGPHAEKRWR